MKRAWVTVALIAFQGGIFFFLLSLPYARSIELLSNFGLVPARDFANVFELPLSQRIPTFFGSTFLPSGLSSGVGSGVAQILLNLVPFLFFAPRVELRMRAFGFLMFYLLCGLIAGVVQAGLQPTSAVPIVGAFGPVAGVMGAALGLLPRWRIVVFIVLWFILQYPFLEARGGYAGPIAAFVGGLCLHRFFVPGFQRSQKAQKT